MAEFEFDPFLSHEPMPVYTSTPTKNDTAATSSLHEESDVSMYQPDQSLSQTTMQQDSIMTAPTPEHQREYFVVARESLWELLQNCPSCSKPCLVDVVYQQGSFVSVSQECSRCVLVRRWNSQPFRSNIPAGNLKMAAAIHFNGGSASKVFRIFDTMNLARISYSTYHRYQKSILQPVVWHCWLDQQRVLLDQLTDMGGTLNVCGDSRSDSPGHCAQYGSYSFLETSINKVIHFELIKVCDM
jgi:hypothetical protein